MKHNKMFATISLLLIMLLLTACNSGSNNNENSKSVKNQSTQSEMNETIKSNVYSKNTLHQMIVTGNPKKITTSHTFVDEDAWGLGTIQPSFNASTQFDSWYEGEVTLDEEGYLLTYVPFDFTETSYTYDNGLRTTNYSVGGTSLFRVEERIEGDYIAEYYINIESDDETLVAKYVKDSNNETIKLIGRYAGSPEVFDEDYEYENGNLKKITKTRDGEFLSSMELEYDTLPVKLIINNSDETTVVFTFLYEFDKEGNWIKCEKYKDDLLIVTYERTIEY